MTPREAWALYSCYGCDEVAVNTLLTQMWIEAGRPPRKESDLAAWEAVHGDSVGVADSWGQLVARRERERRAADSRRLDKEMNDAIDATIRFQLGEDWDK